MTSPLRAEFSWNQPQSEVTPQGDIRWTPTPFEFRAGPSIRYIDYEVGNDGNPGTKIAPWKHHPWDAQAIGAAAQCRGVHTYVFKRGVVYRGKLMARDSGTEQEPIRLTSDPSWGNGEAALYGSERVTGPWRRCSKAEAPDLAEPEKVWFVNIGTNFAPRALWMLKKGVVTRIPMARSPNWTITNPDDPQSNWYEWEGYDEKTQQAKDSKHLTQPDARFYEGGHLWSSTILSAPNMNGIIFLPIKNYNPIQHTLEMPTLAKGNCYFIENVRALLDGPGEYFYSEKPDLIAGSGRPGLAVVGKEEPQNGLLYVRLPDDLDPNTVEIEVSKVLWPIEVRHQSHIAISGLTLSFDSIGHNWGSSWPEHAYEPCFVRVIGDCRDVSVSNCKIQHVTAALRAFPRMDPVTNGKWLKDMVEPKGRKDWMDGIVFQDNDVAYSERNPLEFRDGRGVGALVGEDAPEFRSAKVLRNRFYYSTYRRGGNPFPSVAVIAATNVRLLEVAGNVIDYAWGSGIHICGAKQGGDLRDIPLARTLVYNNKVTNVMLGCNDYGGIAIWQGGTQYVYNNVCGNSVGYRPFTFRAAPTEAEALKSSWITHSASYYIDGGYKNYLFNNIAWGKNSVYENPYRNRTAFNMVMGFMNHWFNNTASDFLFGLHGSSGQRNSFLGNLLEGMTESFIMQNRTGSLDMLGGGETGDRAMSFIQSGRYGYNVLHGHPRNFVKIRQIGGTNFEEFAASMQKTPLSFSHPGWYSEKSSVRAAKEKDFSLRPGSAAINRGVKFFVPWALYGTVGEWNFCRSAVSPDRVVGENFYMTEEFLTRDMYYDIPTQDLKVPGATAKDYIAGNLEDWVEGALVFDGKTRYAVYPDAEMKADYSRGAQVIEGETKIKKGTSLFPGSKRKTVDMGTNNFLIEVVFKTETRQACALVSKEKENGYRLGINRDGKLTFSLRAGGNLLCARSGDTALHDGRWHHVLVEVTRGTQPMMALYVDGKLETGVQTGTLPESSVSLSNTGDFYVGRSESGDYFAGAVDFLRVCRGTLADAHTTIGELYAWQFNGPFLRDMRGLKPKDGKRDAGALAVE